MAPICTRLKLTLMFNTKSKKKNEKPSVNNKFYSPFKAFFGDAMRNTRKIEAKVMNQQSLLFSPTPVDHMIMMSAFYFYFEIEVSIEFCCTSWVKPEHFGS